MKRTLIFFLVLCFLFSYPHLLVMGQENRFSSSVQSVAPDEVSQFLENIAGTWKGKFFWVDRGPQSRNVELVVKRDMDKGGNVPPSLTWSLESASTGSGHLANEQMRAVVENYKPRFVKKDGEIYMQFGRRNIELHLEGRALVGGYATANWDTKCVLEKVQSASK